MWCVADQKAEYDGCVLTQELLRMQSEDEAASVGAAGLDQRESVWSDDSKGTKK